MTEIVFLFYDGMTALDAVGPHEVFSRLPNARLFRAARRKGAVMTDSGLALQADSALQEIDRADILLIPGAGSAATLRNFPETLDWIRKLHASTAWTTSVCTGSLILGAAGILQNLHATTHWAALDRLKMWGAKPCHSRVVEDGKVITAAGVSAGIDMALALAAKIAGAPFAEALQLGIEYDPAPPFKSGSPQKADPGLCSLLRAKMQASFEGID